MLEVDNLKKYLKNKLTENNFSEYFLIIDEVLSESYPDFNDYILIKSRQFLWEKEFNYQRVSIDDYNINMNKIKLSILHLVENLREEFLIDSWQEYVFSKDDDGPEEDIRQEEIQITKDDIILPESIGLDDQKKLEFKRLLILCQDEIEVENYSEAYDHVKKIRETLEPESAQLYEYLLISFFKMHNTGEIITEYLNDNLKLYKHIKLYCNRHKSYQVKNICPSHSGLKNIKEIAYHLSSSLKQQYLNINDSYITSDPSKVKSKYYEKIQKIIKLYNSICKDIFETRTLHEIMILEFSNSGVIDWYRKSGDEIQNNTEFNALKKLEQLLSEVDFHNNQEVSKNIRRKVHYNLKKQYIKIEPYEDPKTKARYWLDDKRISFIRLIKSFFIAYILLKQDETFIDIPINELLGNGKMDWIELDENSNLINNDKCNKVGYDALEELKSLVDKSSKYNLEKTFQELKDNSLDKITKENLKNYNKLGLIIKKNEENSSQRMELVNIIRNWLICYNYSGKLEYAKLIVNELLGNKYLNWFTINNNGELQELNIYTANDFQTFNTCKVLCGKLGINNYQEVLVKNYYNTLLGKYHNISTGYANDEEANRLFIIDFIHRSIVCFNEIEVRNIDYLNLVMKELQNKGKYNWTEPWMFFWKKNNSQSLQLNFDAISELKKIKGLKKNWV